MQLYVRITWRGLLTADARRVMDMELVLDAKMAERFVILSNWINNFFFTSSDSTIASITISTVLSSSRFEVQRRRPNASLCTSCWVETKTHQHIHHFNQCGSINQQEQCLWKQIKRIYRNPKIFFQLSNSPSIKVNTSLHTLATHLPHGCKPKT